MEIKSSDENNNGCQRVNPRVVLTADHAHDSSKRITKAADSTGKLERAAWCSRTGLANHGEWTSRRDTLPAPLLRCRNECGLMFRPVVKCRRIKVRARIPDQRVNFRIDFETRKRGRIAERPVDLAFED